jgi:hypothetical protein
VFLTATPAASLDATGSLCSLCLVSAGIETQQRFPPACSFVYLHSARAPSHHHSPPLTNKHGSSIITRILTTSPPHRLPTSPPTPTLTLASAPAPCPFACAEPPLIN